MIPPPQGVPPPMPMASHMNMMPPQSMNMNANAPPLGPPPGPVPGMGGYPLYPPYHDQPPNDNMSTYSTNMKEPNIGLVADVLRIGLMSGGGKCKHLIVFNHGMIEYQISKLIMQIFRDVQTITTYTGATISE